MEEKIYNMKLFEKLDITSRKQLTRVPGGWVLRDLIYHASYAPSQCSVFIPFNNEFENYIDFKISKPTSGISVG